MQQPPAHRLALHHQASHHDAGALGDKGSRDGWVGVARVLQDGRHGWSEGSVCGGGRACDCPGRAARATLLQKTWPARVPATAGLQPYLGHQDERLVDIVIHNGGHRAGALGMSHLPGQAGGGTAFGRAAAGWLSSAHAGWAEASNHARQQSCWSSSYSSS